MGVVVKAVCHSPESPETHAAECLSLQHELDVLSKVQHPHIIGLSGDTGLVKHAVLNQRVSCYLEFEKCDTDLYYLIEHTYPKIINIQYLKAWFYQVALALRKMH